MKQEHWMLHHKEDWMISKVFVIGEFKILKKVFRFFEFVNPFYGILSFISRTTKNNIFESIL